MKRTVHRAILSLTALLVAAAQWGCGIPENSLALYQRSLVVQDRTTQERILAKATMEEAAAQDAMPVRILHLRGTPYEMGFQHGSLLREDIQAMYAQIIRRVKFYVSEDMLDELYDVMAPYIPLEEKEEMRGLAHGADVTIRVVHWVHSIPELSEYGPKKRFRKGFKQTSCSNLVAFGKATSGGEVYQLRVLDWIRNFGVQQWPVVLVHHPDEGHGSVTFSYAGFIGTVSGMNDQRLVFGEMGYGDPPAETLEGIPFIFLFRKLMREADSLADVERTIRNVKRTNSYVYVVSDAKALEDQTNALLFITDRDRVLTYRENTHLIDERDGGDNYPPIDDVVYGGAKGDVLHDTILRYYGQIAPQTLMELTRPVSLKSNMQNVIFRPSTFEVWVSNASLEKGEAGKASNQPWLHLDFSSALEGQTTVSERVPVQSPDEPETTLQGGVTSNMDRM